jgi:hydroxymethylbilane synthase
VETRAGDTATIDVVRAAIHDPSAATRVEAERAFLARMGGGCQTPLAAHAVLVGNELSLDVLVGQPDGTLLLRAHHRGPAEQAATLGEIAAADVLSRGAGAIIEALIEASR